MLKLSDIKLNQYIQQGKAFVLYRLPEKQEAFFIKAEEGKGQNLASLKDLNTASAFVFAPFSTNTDTPILLINGAKIPIQLNDVEGQKETIKHDEISLNKIVDEVYTKDFQAFKQALEQEDYQKLVLARTKLIQQDVTAKLKELFTLACHCYKSAFTYLIYTKESGLWLGASPECLLRSEGKACTSVALAGTQALEEGKGLPQEWSKELQREQKLVSQYLKKQLESLGLKYTLSPRRSVSAGRVAHLRTDVDFFLDGKVGLGDVLDKLHPTPALCGLPKEEAKDFIEQNESLDRTYYGGFLGELALQGATNLYVNIRSMKINEQSIVYYAGGGLLQSSILQDEWLETERKMCTMQEIVQLATQE